MPCSLIKLGQGRDCPCPKDLRAACLKIMSRIDGRAELQTEAYGSKGLDGEGAGAASGRLKTEQAFASVFASNTQGRAA